MGAPEGEQRALCTSVPGVLPWVERSVERVFREVPGLGGVFTITASGEFDKLCFAGRTAKLRTVPEPVVRRSDRRGQSGDNRRSQTGRSRCQSAGVGLGMERCLCRGDYFEVAEIVLADVGERVVVAGSSVAECRLPWANMRCRP